MDVVVWIATVGAMVLLGALRLLHGAAAAATGPGTNLLPSVADFESQFARLGELERRIFSTLLRRGATPVDPNRSFDAQLSIGERLAGAHVMRRRTP